MFVSLANLSQLIKVSPLSQVSLWLPIFSLHSMVVDYRFTSHLSHCQGSSLLIHHKFSYFAFLYNLHSDRKPTMNHRSSDEGPSEPSSSQPSFEITPTKYIEIETSALHSDYEIPNGFQVVIPRLTNTPHRPPPGCVTFFYGQLTKAFVFLSLISSKSLPPTSIFL